ncbi:tetratricopeptide repeat-containing sulfotransferase family protein [Lysobacter sp. TY2-98]|uniref:tetratricopeptide repeat-containing sulfotransferase family protein n=1 Tax=Lysobacter sp. TY2-98 TaxID=2290922 RepID=UPI001F088432|nr:tetratricopeptide repeat-containing sulfotransferase family protein [Lysobacter sp. TY2-98]
MTAEPRMAGLDAAQVAELHAAARAIRDNRPDEARRRIDAVLAAVPGHAEALRLSGLLHGRRGDRGKALEVFLHAVALHPDDALLICDLGSAHAASGDPDAALASWRRACDLAPQEPMPWFNLGRSLQQRGDSEEAVGILQKAASLAPAMLPARILLADALVHLGRFDEAMAQYRDVLRQYPACGDAWRGLSSIRTRALTDTEATQLQALLARHDIADTDRIAMGYALGRLEEDRGRHPQAFAALSAANGALRARAPWSANALRGYVDAALAATSELPAPLDATLGREVIFIVGLPRSGSTLFEQILAAHPEMEGASELPDLGQLVQEESLRRGQPYPQWVPQATAEDWQRLGRDYLARTARWRTSRPRFTDKMPENWKHAGILRAMLPGATVLEVRRDPLETGWSCFRQQFFQLPHFSCDLTDIGAYLRICGRAMDAWRARDPQHILLQRYEDLVAAPEARIRALLDACGLPFDARCLDFHAASRSVRTASAAQVRQPVRGDTARAAAYGALLDPLRRALAAD